jgi:hypothetical protein
MSCVFPVASLIHSHHHGANGVVYAGFTNYLHLYFAKIDIASCHERAQALLNVPADSFFARAFMLDE